MGQIISYFTSTNNITYNNADNTDDNDNTNDTENSEDVSEETALVEENEKGSVTDDEVVCEEKTSDIV